MNTFCNETSCYDPFHFPSFYKQNMQWDLHSELHAVELNHDRDLKPYVRDIESCAKDEYSLFRSRLRSTRHLNSEYSPFGQSSISILLYGGCFCRISPQNSRQKRHPFNKAPSFSKRIVIMSKSRNTWQRESHPAEEHNSLAFWTCPEVGRNTEI